MTRFCAFCLVAVMAAAGAYAEDDGGSFAPGWDLAQNPDGFALEAYAPDSAPVVVDKYAGLAGCTIVDAGEDFPDVSGDFGSASVVVEATAPTVATRVDDMFFADVPVVLTPKEDYAIGLARPWRDQEKSDVSPIVGDGGTIQFVYSHERPSIVCAVLQITDIQLQRGEIIQSVNIGDSARWVIDPATSGEDTPHILIKPIDVGLNTSLIIATNKRMYHFRLRSTRDEYMARVSFVYADEKLELARLEKMRAEAEAKREQERRDRDTIPETREYLGDLDFAYTITGKARWKPTRVYNDGVKTIIEMPETLSQDDSPTLLVLRKSGGVFRKDEEVMVNYRVQRNRYVVDAVFDKAKLIVGVGRNQARVVIEREGRGK